MREDDIFIVSFPKCGTTLTMELAWLLSHQADVATASTVRGGRCAFLEGPAILNTPGWQEYYQGLEQVSSPRVFNTHLPIDLLPATLLTGQVVWVGRGVKDCLVSYYHHNRLLKVHNYKGDFKTFARLFQAGSLPYGSYWAQLTAFWPLHSHPRVRLIWYETLAQDRPGSIRCLATFLGYSLSEEQYKLVEDFLNIDNYKRVCQLGNKDSWNPGCGEFVRKGVVGDWTEYLSEEEGREWDTWARIYVHRIGIKDQSVKQILGVI